GVELGGVVAGGGQPVLVGYRIKGRGAGFVEVSRRKSIAGGNVRETDQRVHQRELTRVIEREPGEAFPSGQARGVGELAQLAAVDEGLQDVLLDGERAIDDGGHRGTELRHVLEPLRTPKSLTLLDIASVRR